jgi:hypothetical protein
MRSQKEFFIKGSCWSDSRNRMNVDTVEAERLVKINFEMKCNEFKEYVSSPKQKPLLRECRSNNKY